MIKKKLVFILTAALLLGACSNEPAGTSDEDETTDDLNSSENEAAQMNTIVESELTERERVILDIVADESLVFDFNVDSDFKEARLWVEKYEFGELADYYLGHIIADVSDSGYVMFAPTELSGMDNEILFNIGLSSNLSTVSSKSSEILASDDSSDTESDEDGVSTGIVWSTATSDESDLANGEIVLGSLVYANMEEGISTLSPDFYADVEGHIEEIEDYEGVYLMKIEFTR